MTSTPQYATLASPPHVLPGRTHDATQAAIAASLETPGLIRISAGNYGGRLGKRFIYLHPDKQPPLE